MFHAAIQYAAKFIGETQFEKPGKHYSGLAPIELDTFCKNLISFAEREGVSIVNARFGTSYKRFADMKKAKVKDHIDFYYDGEGIDGQIKGYKFIYGAVGEILVMVWLYLFGHLYDIGDVRDTSHNETQRGVDFIARAMNATWMYGIQVKMRADDEAVFTTKTLHTLMDELSRVGYWRVFLVVPTSTLDKEEAVTYKYGLNKDVNICFIGHKAMTYRIKGWEHPEYGKKLEGFWNFFKRVVSDIHSHSVSQPKLVTDWPNVTN